MPDDRAFVLGDSLEALVTEMTAIAEKLVDDEIAAELHSLAGGVRRLAAQQRDRDLAGN